MFLKFINEKIVRSFKIIKNNYLKSFFIESKTNYLKHIGYLSNKIKRMRN